VYRYESDMRISSYKSPEFGVTASCSGAKVVLAVRREIDVVTVPELTACLDAASGPGARSVVVDLANVDFIGSAGLAEGSRATRSLETLGAELSISSPSATVRRILTAFGMGELAHPEQPDLFIDSLGLEQTDNWKSHRRIGTAERGDCIQRPSALVARSRSSTAGTGLSPLGAPARAWARKEGP
jgi:anti-sigma B factor antagonist